MSTEQNVQQGENLLAAADEPPRSSGDYPIVATLFPEETQILRATMKKTSRNARRTESPCAPSKSPRFPLSAGIDAFRQRYFPDASASDWSNWHWQLKNIQRGHEAISRFINLTDDERNAMDGAKGGLPTAVTPYYASLLHPDNSGQALRRSMIPTTAEFIHSPGEDEDPLGEEGQCPTSGLVHRYPDRVLFMTTGYCAAYCRYCTRSRLVGQNVRKHFCRAQWEKAIDYIAATPAVRDVILSGGDPLTINDESLEWLLRRLRAIPHVEMIRIGTKTPAVLPMRITASLTKMLKKYHPLWMSIHFTHPDELTPETVEACERLADAGIPLGSQTVLLKGINDNVPTLKKLFQGLLKARVRPYYLYQCDPILGGEHFRTPVETGLEMIEGLRGHTSGYAVPQYVVDAPGGGGKIPMLPKYTLGHDAQGLAMRNYQNKVFHYPDSAMDT